MTSIISDLTSIERHKIAGTNWCHFRCAAPSAARLFGMSAEKRLFSGMPDAVVRLHKQAKAELRQRKRTEYANNTKRLSQVQEKQNRPGQ